MTDDPHPADPSRRAALTRSAAAIGLAATVGGAVAPGSGLAAAPDRSATILDARAGGAVGDGTTDDTAALQRLIDRARRTPGGATILLPAGRYAVTGLRLRPEGRDDFSRRIALIGEGAGRSVIVPARTDAVLIDAAGCNNLRIERLSIDSGRLFSRIGLLLGRTAASPNCNGGIFADLVIEGSYSVAAAASIAAETTRWRDCRIANGHDGGGHCCFVTGTDPARIAGLRDLGLVAGPNTDNVMTGCLFYAPYRGARMLRFSAGAGWAFFGCSLLAGDAAGVRLVSYADPVDGVFNGPVAWHGCHFEVTSTDACVHWIDAPGGDSYWRHLAIHGGYAVVLPGTPLLDFDRRDPRRRPIVQSMLVQGVAFPPGVGDADLRTFALLDSDISMLGEQGAVVALGFIRNSRVEARDIRTPQVAGRPIRLARDRARRQTFASGMIVENADPGEGEIGSWAVARGGAGTVAPADGGGAPKVGEIVGAAGQPRTVWHRAPSGELTLDQGRTGASTGFARPLLTRLGS